MLDETLATIEAAFADVPQPPDGELLHERCFDDNDIVALYGVPHWRELDDATVEREYAALAFVPEQAFTVSKLEPLDDRRRGAIVTFLEAVREHDDEHVAAEAELALRWWRA